MSETAIKEQQVIEGERTYIYPNPYRQNTVMTNTLIDITGIKVLGSGAHIVNTKYGNEHYVGAGFINVVTKPVKKSN